MPNEQKYEVQAIMNHKRRKNGGYIYHIRWKNYLPDYDTWEDANNLTCPDLIREYDNGKGIDASIQRNKINLNDFFDKTDWIEFLEESSISGSGVRAKCNIPPKRLLCKYFDEVKLTKKQVIAQYKDRKSKGLGANVYHIKHWSGVYFDAFGVGPEKSLAHFCNHSCEPNAEAVEFDKEIWIASLRTIQKNEEITFNYALSVEPSESPSICRCLKESCVGVMEDRDHPVVKNLHKQFPDFPKMIKSIIQNSQFVEKDLNILQAKLKKKMFESSDKPKKKIDGKAGYVKWSRKA